MMRIKAKRRAKTLSSLELGYSTNPITLRSKLAGLPYR